MDYNIINEFVQTLEQTKEICRRYEAGRLENNQLCNYYEDDLLRMGYLLSSMDGVININELDLLTGAFNIVRDEKLLKKFYWEDILKKNNFLNKIPKSIMYVICEERKSYKDAFSIYLKDSRALYKTLKKFGYLVISCNTLKMPYEVAALENMCKNILNVILNAEDMDIYYEEKDISGQDININEMKKSMINGVNNQPDNFYSVGNNNAEFYNPYKNTPDFSGYYDVVKTGKSEKTEKTQGSGYVNDNIAANIKINTFTPDHVPDNSYDEDLVKEVLEGIDGMTGLDCVKKEIHGLVNLLQVQRLREQMRQEQLAQPIDGYVEITGTLNGDPVYFTLNVDDGYGDGTFYNRKIDVFMSVAGSISRTGFSLESYDYKSDWVFNASSSNGVNYTGNASNGSVTYRMNLKLL